MKKTIIIVAALLLAFLIYVINNPDTGNSWI